MNRENALGRVAVRIGVPAVLAAALMSGGTGHAADLPPPTVVEEPAPASGWKYQISVYGWAPSLSGNIGLGNLPTSSVHIPFSDVLKHLNGALMGSLFARNGNWLLLADVFFAKLSDSRELAAFGGAWLDGELTQTIADGAIGYILPTGRPDFDVAITGGARYMSMKGEVSFHSLVLPAGPSVSQRKWWIDPTIGFFARWEPDEKWFVNAIADIGGFGVGSKLSSTGYLGLGYMWTESFSTALGYRYLYEDYEGDRTSTGTFRYKVTMHGPTVSMAWRF